MKKVVWQGSSRADLKSFPVAMMDAAGYQLFRVQSGLDPDDWKPMPSIGPGVKEIRLRDATGAFRIIYIATLPQGVYVLHCFQKKSQKTNAQDIQLARARLKAILR
ncbi:MAG: type II toxin-antitoxin system RelE/ParE family toxin [Steroidobacteraceae bacterium]